VTVVSTSELHRIWVVDVTYGPGETRRFRFEDLTMTEEERKTAAWECSAKAIRAGFTAVTEEVFSK